MPITISTNKNYTEFQQVYQQKLPLELEMLIPVDDSVRLLSQLLEGLDYSKLYQAYSIKGRNGVERFVFINKCELKIIYLR